MTVTLAARRGIVDRASGAEVVDVAGKAMTHTVYRKLPRTSSSATPTLTILGLLTRLQAFHAAATREIAADNPFSSAALLRSLAEVVALVCYLIKKPGELRRVSMRADNKDRFKIGTLIEAGAREAPAFKESYARLSNLAHPSYARANSSVTISDEGALHLAVATIVQGR